MNYGQMGTCTDDAFCLSERIWRTPKRPWISGFQRKHKISRYNLQEAGCTLDFDSDEQPSCDWFAWNISWSPEFSSSFTQTVSAVIMSWWYQWTEDDLGWWYADDNFDGETLPDDPTVFIFTHHVRVIWDWKYWMMTVIRSYPIYTVMWIRTDKGGNHIRLSTQVVRGEGGSLLGAFKQGTINFSFKVLLTGDVVKYFILLIMFFQYVYAGTGVS